MYIHLESNCLTQSCIYVKCWHVLYPTYCTYYWIYGTQIKYQISNVDLQVLLPHSNLFSARPFRCYPLPYFTTHWTFPSLPQVIKTLPFLCSYAAMTAVYDLLNLLFWGGGGHSQSSKLNNGVSESGCFCLTQRRTLQSKPIR